MPKEHLKSNLVNLLKDVNSLRPKREGKFITRVIMTSPPSRETLKIDPSEFPFEDTLNATLSKGKRGKKAAPVEVVEELDEQKEERVAA